MPFINIVINNIGVVHLSEEGIYIIDKSGNAIKKDSGEMSASLSLNIM